MFDGFMTLCDSINEYAPIVALMVFVVASRIMLRHEMHRMRQLESDIRAERNKLMHERTELERRYHMYM